MNEVREALLSVRKQYPNFEIIGCLDNGDFYSFSRMIKGDTLEHHNQCVGGPTDIGYNKKTGRIYEIDHYAIMLDGILDNGKPVDISGM